jgi:hypothetical protein
LVLNGRITGLQSVEINFKPYSGKKQVSADRKFIAWWGEIKAKKYPGKNSGVI